MIQMLCQDEQKEDIKINKKECSLNKKSIGCYKTLEAVLLILTTSKSLKDFGTKY